ncbi:peptidoglycan/xylan/chitin deacetylase (PgdA/CDA1 family) [Isoptericola sp. CG 20/1183]|uniref:Peptidoglycan/xylan/chitin deacetylase (PgdA/CDA1 family) n=1 Tax=Isoptericola halotolerans TaxID=300560 RepID=A0ABX5EHN5_9MICO|nr:MULTISPECIES: polysaccharide deacetylase family protein [Isoptericola]PRZ08850.1 peptidoglycan/xylan/chitin deacetylase (PgdA/CDA1 family) [Isoptericola halotolerans]PRZ10703.1 peptidoglycan/xylan/chitin deacetylase (PgdA/CDA1 family) [Isoptericola sp. CG 20/1183]
MSTPHGPDAASGPGPRRRARRWWIAAIVAVLVAAGAVVAGVLEHRAWVGTVATYEAEVARVTEDAATSRARAEEAYAASRDALDDAVDGGRPVLAGSEGQVGDPAVRAPLAAALDQAERLRDAEVTYPVSTRTVEEVTRPNLFRPQTLPRVEAEVVDGSDPAPAELHAAAAAVTAATAVVVEARQEWALEELQAAATEGRDALTELRPQVGAATLGELDAAVTDAEAMTDAGADALDPDDAVALRDTLLDTTETLWTDRLDQIVADRRRAARADGVDCREDRCVALTFDDGPVAETQRLLRILERKDAPATFFMVGDNVAARPEIARAVVDGGHLVGNHTWNHPQLTTLDDGEVRDEIRRTQDAVTDATGSTPFLLRPPYGDVDGRVRSLATRTGLDVVLWSLDTRDWESRDAREIRRRVRAEVEPGSNILLHDIHATSVDAVPKIIADLRKENYVLVTADLLVGPDEP